MEISFKSDGEVQIVEMGGIIGETEAAAIRFKLGEKINGGKNKILLDLRQVAPLNDAVRVAVFSIAHYVLARQVLLMICGLPLDQWGATVLPDGRQIKNFLTKAEALIYAASVAAPDPKAHLREVTSTNDEEAKAKALRKLLEKYEVFQHGADLDPFRLEFLAAQYKNSPHREALNIEVRVREAIGQVQSENAGLTQECEVLGAQLKQKITYRKSPLGPKEFEAKEKALAGEVQAVTAARNEVQHELEQLQLEMSDNRKQCEARLKTLEAEKAGFKTRLREVRDQFAEEEESLKVKDAQEQKDFEASQKH